MRSHKLSMVLAVGLAGWFLGSGLAQAADFSATTVTRMAGQELKGKIYVKGEKIRMKTPTPLGSTVSILRLDKKVMWILLPGQKTYMEMPFDRQAYAKALNLPADEGKKKLVGTEMLNGYETEKYVILGDHGKSTVWVAKKLGVPIRLESADKSIRQDYQDIKIGGVSDSLFEIPAGYQKLSMPAGLPNM